MVYELLGALKSYPIMVVSEVTSRTRLPGLFSAKSLATLRPATPPEQPMK